MADRRVRRSIDRLVAAEPLRRAAHDAHHAERHDERHHAEPGHNGSVHEADAATRRHEDQHRGDRRPTGHEQLRSEDAAEGNHRADAEIDPATDDDERHPERADGHDDRLRQDVLEVAAGEDELALLGQSEQRADEQQPEEWAACLKNSGETRHPGAMTKAEGQRPNPGLATTPSNTWRSAERAGRPFRVPSCSPSL